MASVIFLREVLIKVIFFISIYILKTKLYDLTRDLSKIQLKVGDNTP